LCTLHSWFEQFKYLISLKLWKEEKGFSNCKTASSDLQYRYW
jgi:hypothetical protein